VPYLILDGKVVDTGRCREPAARSNKLPLVVLRPVADDSRSDGVEDLDRHAARVGVGLEHQQVTAPNLSEFRQPCPVQANAIANGI
jgi:hypothetical protein